MAAPGAGEPAAAAPVAVRGLTKRFGRTTAVEDLSFALRAGRVTGFLGRNGAGKTTTLRMLLGLARPTAGEPLIHGVPFAELPDPRRTVGAVVSPGLHPGRSARDHLRVVAAACDASPARVEACLELAGLAGVERLPARALSTGMRSRLAIAVALVGEPRILLLDEPAAGLDPAGVRWLRDTLRAHAARGGTVLVSSHLLAELAHTVDDALVIDRGRLIAHGPLDELTRRATGGLRVRAGDPEALAAAIRRAGGEAARRGELLLVHGLAGDAVGDMALELGTPVWELAPEAPALEEAFLALTAEPAREPRDERAPRRARASQTAPGAGERRR